MRNLSANFWPSARAFAEAVQCPAVCFEEPTLKGMLPAVDRLGMPLVTSGQFAYVFKLNSPHGGDALAVRCFRGFHGGREERYRALDSHLAAHPAPALPRFKYLPEGVLVAGRRFPVLVMEWVAGPTLDVYLGEVVGRREVVLHMAGEWLRLMESLRAAGVAHGDLQHGNVIVERGRMRLVDLDGMYVPALAGLSASELGHQHYQHPARGADLFSPAVDNFSALVVYLSLVALAERPELWREHHDENLIFTRADFRDPEASALFRKVRETGPEQARLADALAAAAKAPPAETPWLLDLVEAQPRLPAWMAAPAGVEVGGRTREVERAGVAVAEVEPAWGRGRQRRPPTALTSNTVQTIFGGRPVKGGPVVADPSDISGNTFFFAGRAAVNSYAYIWWFFVHDSILSFFWQGFGVYSAGASTVCSVLFGVAVFLVYGLGRAFYEWDTASQQPAAQLPAGTVFAPPLPLAAPAEQPAGTPLFGAAPAPASGVHRVVGNASLRLYHRPTCVWVDRIAARRRADFDSASSAHAAGYRPCRVCAP
ncbi:MAG TPA: Ada metal-binding domain-containing protein [Pyrinomonadaceae bacterium]|nr:Ada metal-binding domain-containing protein [Pyrinomonadaceae bacterium]